MSMELMVKAMKAKVGNPLRKLVLIKLADNANDNGECWPSHQHIADQCEIGHSTVRKHIAALVDMGFVTIKNRKGPKGNLTNIYTISICYEVAPPVPPDSTEEVPPDSIGMPPDSTPPVPPDSTGIYHSFEPIKESLKDSCPATSAKSVFNAFFKAYPAHRKGGSDSAAWKAWKAEKLTDADCVLAVSWLKEAAALDASWGFSANGQFVLGITKFIRERHWLTPLPRSMAAAVGQVDWRHAVYDPEDPLI
ncbi:helix-turn-helix domain-containing protein [Shewanella scandinavica]|uniref:Helix-turn-helix domain-containing protein n=1 Tax=Shewanella scandinavica TaxID=3063538 RepID=A0ABU3G222_9GAMM|nr:helix-turn-helix domain-containing protein [Shewanella sp. SP2S1-2]MDT3281661.1 helix-turn-helix domain-containing protein [Shewanella sp. SP2S1-2]